MNASIELNSAPYGTAFVNTLNERIIPGSAQYWATHFSPQQTRLGTQAVLSFASLMDELAIASQEVIADKSVWWHEELERLQHTKARHPVCCALQHYLQHSCTELALSDEHIVASMHRQLHGALMTQQKYLIDSIDAWNEYADLRLGSVHTLLELVHGNDPARSEQFGQWAGRIHLLAASRKPKLFNDGRWLPSDATPWTNESSASLQDHIQLQQQQKPSAGNPSSEILMHHDLKWWQRTTDEPSPMFSNAPLGFGGLFSSWRVARRALSEAKLLV